MSDHSEGGDVKREGKPWVIPNLIFNNKFHLFFKRLLVTSTRTNINFDFYLVIAA